MASNNDFAGLDADIPGRAGKMKTERIKRRLNRVEKAVADALNVVKIYYLVSLPGGEELEIPPGKLKEYEEQGATFKDVIIHVPDNAGAERGKKWH